jgi:hypothetical protein
MISVVITKNGMFDSPFSLNLNHMLYQSAIYELVINCNCDFFTYAVCGAVEAATETTLSTLSSVPYRFLGFISLVFEQNSAYLATVLLLIIGMLLFLTIADKIRSLSSQVVR